MENEKLVPKLRFMEWSSSWVNCKIEDIAEIVGGGTPKTEVDSYWDGNIIKNND